MGCAGDSTGSATPVAPVIAVERIVPAAVAPPASAPVASAHVDAHGCRLEGKIRQYLRISHDARDPGATFATIADVDDAKIVLGESERASSSVEVDVLGLAFDAQVPEGGMNLHAHAPLGLSGVYDPDKSTPLRWRLADAGVIVSAEPEADVKPLVALEGAVSCATIGLEQKSFDRRQLPKELYGAVTTKAIAIAERPGGTPAAELKSGAVVSVVEQTRTHARVAIERRGLWFGWVPLSAIKKEQTGSGYGYGGATGSMPGRPLPGGHVCEQALPIFVRRVGVEQPIARVGSVRPHRRIALALDVGEDTYRALLDEQRVRSSDRPIIHVEDGYELVLRRDDARGCTPSPE